MAVADGPAPGQVGLVRAEHHPGRGACGSPMATVGQQRAGHGPRLPRGGPDDRGRGRARQGVEGVDELAQAGVGDAVEAQRQPGQVREVLAASFGGQRGVEDADRADAGRRRTRSDSAATSSSVGRDSQADDQGVAHPAQRVVVAVEAEDLGGGVLDVDR